MKLWCTVNMRIQTVEFDPIYKILADDLRNKRF